MNIREDFFITSQDDGKQFGLSKREAMWLLVKDSLDRCLDRRSVPNAGFGDGRVEQLRNPFEFNRSQ